MIEVTGTALIRAALRAKNKKVNLAGMARDLGMTASTLEDFGENRLKTLPPDTLQKITGYIWTNGTRFDPALDLLVPPPMEVKKAGRPPAPYVRTETNYVAGEGFTRKTPITPQPAAKKKPGWLSSW